MAAVVIQLSIRNRRAGSHVRKRRNPPSDLPDFMDPERVRAAVEHNRTLPKVEGMLHKDAPAGIFGFRGQTTHPRWFELDPAGATLSWWKPGQRSRQPQGHLDLERLESFDTNECQQRFFLKFRGRAKMLCFRADSADEFARWMAVLGCYRCDGFVDASHELPKPKAHEPEPVVPTANNFVEYYRALRVEQDDTPGIISHC